MWYFVVEVEGSALEKGGAWWWWGRKALWLFHMLPYVLAFLSGTCVLRACVLICLVVPNSLRPRWLEPARLVCQWDFPGKNTGVSHHFLLQGVGGGAFLDSSIGKESTCNEGYPGLIPGLGRSPGEGKCYPLQHSSLENAMEWVAWVRHDWATFTFLQGIFPTQESNPCFLHWQVDSLSPSHQGSPLVYYLCNILKKQLKRL